MGPVFGYLSNDFALAESAFYRVRNTLHSEAGEIQLSWGIGFIQDGKALLRKRLRASDDGVDLFPAVSELRSHAVVGWMGTAPATYSGPDIPPYRYRNWVLAHFGEIDERAGYVEELRAQLPDFVALKGRGAAEVLLSHVLQQLRRAEKRYDLHANHEQAAAAVARAVHHIRETARLACAEVPPVQNYFLTDGSILIGTSSGAPLYAHRIDGIVDDPVLRRSASPGTRSKRVDHPSFRAMLLLAGSPHPNEIWSRLPDGSVTVVDARLSEYGASIGDLLKKAF